MELDGLLEGTATADGEEIVVNQEFAITAGQTAAPDCETICLATSPVFVEALGADIQLGLLGN